MSHKPREIYLKTYQKPKRAVVYDMEKCHPDFFNKEQEWHLIEYSSYRAIIKQAEKMAAVLEYSIDLQFYSGGGATENWAKEILQSWKEFKK